MNITFAEYKDKVRACWLGKNIGGTLGAPFECIRGVYDITYYTHDLSQGVLPNDDLDLQLCWLNAAEKYGREVNAQVLGEYWLNYVVADWSEYGAGKNNLRFGLLPPVSGWYHNHNKDSCGCFIRSEIWACLAPGHPEIAVKYAYEDAICDHADEGVYGELFCAALQSAAFVESNMEKLVDIAKAYIPADCAVAKAVDAALDCYKQGMDWREARKAILKLVPGSFGMYRGYTDQSPEEDVPVGQLGYDAPSNIGLMMLGWAYGEGDFSKSICIAAGCCEDGDCTAGTLGATLGILYGTKCIDEKWLAPIGDEIKTISLNRTASEFHVPKTVTELTRRVVNLMPTFMYGQYDLTEDGIIEFHDVPDVHRGRVRRGTMTFTTMREELCGNFVGVRKSSPLLDVILTYEDKDIHIRSGEVKPFKLRIVNQFHTHQWLVVKLHLPEAWQVLPGKEMSVYLDNYHGGCGVTEHRFEILPQDITHARYEILVEIKAIGRPTSVYLPIVLLP